ncbi:2'-5' RNA ligase family protein [Clostridium bowmanii]|uniref:2'-5' RNA ligase family protein n=1 Tax=Clostridium bowmanii TaxID=132925 RepID=UPI001C0AFDA3|nr:2'-5' RNA ligase family protein [Clostridium bowmanii]MBU3188522.1 2'-5' RNA ligase family protein [Clostridium bowmanii]MCA1072906.1 2'-5' RNA ligase family protein [Clostridium bowmanii]
MLKRCIMIFPKLDNVRIVDKLRQKYDPLAGHVKPHITLVFPFDSEIETKELKEHLSTVLSKITSFEVILSGVTPTNAFGRYLFLNIQKGGNEIVELHKKLYTGILQSYYPKWLKSKVFLPHMTLGNFDNDKDFAVAINETRNINDSFKCTVNEVTVEIIDENEDSIIELNIALK